ncbi:MAG: hypothetical protein KDF64_08225, partial [Geminicoccaceae bacterium]|nr:hypothetical protein [Geminicoccaceae bacterium]
VVGVEKMSGLSGAAIGDTLLKASYLREESDIDGGFAGVFGQIAQRYFQQHGDCSDALAAIAAKNHANGVANPFAQMRKDLGFDFCRNESDRNPFVPARSSAPTVRSSPTVRRHWCSPMSRPRFR